MTPNPTKEFRVAQPCLLQAPMGAAGEKLCFYSAVGGKRRPCLMSPVQRSAVFCSWPPLKVDSRVFQYPVLRERSRAFTEPWEGSAALAQCHLGSVVLLAPTQSPQQVPSVNLVSLNPLTMPVFGIPL